MSKRDSKKSSLKKRKRKIEEEVILSVKKHKFFAGRKEQKYKREFERRKYKRDYLQNKKLSKRVQKLYKHVKQYKSSVARKYNEDLENAMEGKYFPHEIEIAKEYSIVGKRVKTAVANIPIERWSKDGKRVKLADRKTMISEKQLNSLYKRRIKAARIESYIDILGVSKEKAKEIYNVIDKDSKKAFELKALIY